METQLIIDNKARAATNDAVAERRSPITGKIVTRLAAANVDDALAAADSAAAAFATWSQSTPSERRRILLKAADILETKMDAIVDAMAREVGASALWSGGNVMASVSLLREAASLA